MHPARLNVIHHDRRHSKKRRYDDEFPTIAPPTRAEKHDAAFRGAELDSTAIKSAFAPVLSDSTVPAELSGRRTRVFEVEGILPIVVEPPRAELASKRFSTASSESALVTNPSVSSASSPVSPVTSEQFFSSKGFDSPISPADVSHFLQWSDAQGRHQNSLPVGVSTSAVDSQAHASPWPPASARSQSLWASVGARAALRSCPNIRIDTSCANNRRIDNDLSPESSRDHLGNTPSPLQIESQIQSRVKLVDELRGLFNTTFKISYSKLFQPPPCLTAMGFESYQSAADMFETAWQAVASITHGVLPDTMSEIFALAHLAYACALAVQETDLVDQLPHIFEDLTLWSHAISKSQDRVRYLNLVQKLFDPQLLETGSSGLEDTLDADSSLLTPTPLHRASPGRSSSFPSWPSEGRPLNEMGQLSVPSFDITDHKKLHTSLKNGIIVRLCMQYLNTFEYLATDSGDSEFYQTFVGFDHYPPVTEKTVRNVYVLRRDIIDPLTAMRGVESFRPVIDNAASILSAASNTKLRGLELYLLNEARGFARNQSMYRKFVDTVTRLCDRVYMRLPWERPGRAQYLLKNIEEILALHKELLVNEDADDCRQSQSVPAQEVPGISGMSMTNTDHSSFGPAQDQLPIAESLRPFSWMDTPMSMTSTSSSADMAGLVAQDLTPRPSDALFQPYPAVDLGDMSFPQPMQFSPGLTPLHPDQGTPASETREGSVACPICGRVLQGKLIYLPSNMKRHIRELHKPHAKKLVCPTDGCGRAFARNHNLVQHQRTVHHVGPQGLGDDSPLN
ncbi:MAG: hypothetical protein LQ340_001018 [Diploschistes diacapsis]|nr:MAG: hypothetical protein LQ340_001018 [Diploschistes diacapsis]